MDLLSLVLSIPGLFLALSFRQYFRGCVAYWLGDDTAKQSGRLSMNPLDHLDIVGTLCLLLFRFGWTKPLPINSANFRNHRQGVVLVSLAGPLANFLLALVCTILCKLIYGFISTSQIAEFFYLISIYTVGMNVGLMVFNLIPIPPLDGGVILMEFLPYRTRWQLQNLERYSGIILLVLIWTRMLTPVLNTMAGWVYSLIDLLIFF